MGVIMKGGPSGNRQDSLPNVSVAFDSQKPQDTANNSGMTGMIDVSSQCSGNREGDVNPDVPAGGSPDDKAT